MNPRNTWLWIFAAAFLFAGIFAYNRFAPKKHTAPDRILPGLDAAAISSVEVIPANQRAIHAGRTNDSWQLTEPVFYSANGTNIDRLLAVLKQLAPLGRVSAQEMKSVHDTDAEFGFNPPQITLVLQPGDLHVQVGKRTAPGDGVFIKVVGVDGVFIADADLLRFIPRSADDWRETRLLDLSKLNFDRLAISIAGKSLELQRNATNQLWRMMPMDVRADGGRIQEALAKLDQLRAAQFITDDPKADLESYGLLAPDLSLAFKAGTNTVLLLAFGKSPTNDAAKIYARRNDEKSVVTVAKDLLEPLRAPPENFRDRYLFSPTGPLGAIEIHARENFTLVRTNAGWFVQPQNFPADTAVVNDFLTRLGGMQVAKFVKDVAVEQSLPDWGLAQPAYQIIMLATNAAGSGGATTAVGEMDFGTNRDDLVFARRTDERSIYGVKMEDFQSLPQTALQLRERRIWNFTERDIAGITVQQGGKTWQLNRRGTNQWSLAAGSQGMINEFALEETAHRLGELTADAWVQRGDQNRESFGFNPDDQRISITLTNGQKPGFELGGQAGMGSPYAEVTIDGEPWIFTFPPVLYQFVQLYLTMPAGAP